MRLLKGVFGKVLDIKVAKSLSLLSHKINTQSKKWR